MNGGLRFFLSVFACLALAGGAAGAEEKKSVRERAEENRSLIARYAQSVVTVRYYFKRDAEGNEPDLRIPYRCPNCSSTHYRTSRYSFDDDIPEEFVGYVTGSDEVYIQDVAVPPEFLDRIEVVSGDETVAARESECCPDANALVLKTEKPLSHVKPLAFAADGEPKEPRYFYIVSENGLVVSRVDGSRMETFCHYAVGPGYDIYYGRPNTIVLNEANEPVTLAFQTKIAFGEEVFAPPSSWRREPAELRFQRRDERFAALAKSVIPVYLQLEAPAKETTRRNGISFSFSSDDTVRGNDIDSVAVLINDTVIVPVKLSPEQTARLVKIEATLPDGTKAPLTFVGSSAKYGVMYVKFAEGVPPGLTSLAADLRPALDFFNTSLHMVAIRNLGGSVKMCGGESEIASFQLGKGNTVEIALDRYDDRPRGVWPKNVDFDRLAAGLWLSDKGVVILSVKPRQGERFMRESAALQGTDLAAFLNAPTLDAENVPRSLEDRKRVPYLGVTVERASAEILREQKAAGYFSGYEAEVAAVVTVVDPKSPAAGLGIKTGDVLISAKAKGGREVRLAAGRDIMTAFNWEEIFGSAMFEDMISRSGATPWPDLEGGINAILAQNFSVGSEVVVAWVSGGKRCEGTCRLALAPVHFQNAPKSRNKELGLTVCDMTDEVRAYFKIEAEAPGVVISKVKGGGVASVAGLKPLELILEVNGEGVASARDFSEKVKGQKTLNFKVRRLTKSRMVPLSL